MTRYEHLMSLTLEEMAQELCNLMSINCDLCPANKYCYKNHVGMKHYLYEDLKGKKMWEDPEE